MMKMMLAILLMIIISSSCAFQKSATLYGISYKTKVFKNYGDYEIWYVSELYRHNNKNMFTMTVKGLRNDSVVMVAKKRILEDKIIVTEIYTNVEDVDSIVRTMYFKNGVYLESTYKSYYNNKWLPNRININDPEIQKILPKKN